ncbi:MAG: exodeoxyribonuclease VII large subunit [Thermofilaceae archaeon]
MTNNINKQLSTTDSPKANVNPQSSISIPFILSPKEIIELVHSTVPQMIPIKVIGKLYLKNGYFRLVGPDNYEITLENVKDYSLIDSIVEVSGLLKLYPHINGGLYIRLVTKKINPLPTNLDNQIKEDYTEKYILDKCRKKRFFGFNSYIKKLITDKLSSLNDPKSIPSNEYLLSIAVIHGKQAQTHIDFEQALCSSFPQAPNLLKITYHEVPLSLDDSLSTTIEKVAKNHDLIFIVRGGGEKDELSRIGGPKTIDAILNINKPVYLAIGHSLDKNNTPLYLVADDSFPTPSIAGTELGETIKTVLTIASLPKLTQEEANTKAELKLLQEKLNDLQRNYEKSLEEKNKLKTIIFALSSILIVLIFFFFLK